MTNDNKMARPRLQLMTAAGMSVVGCGLLIAGFVVPPVGQVHPSVLIAFGEILTFVGALLGIDYHYKERWTRKACR